MQWLRFREVICPTCCIANNEQSGLGPTFLFSRFHPSHSFIVLRKFHTGVKSMDFETRLLVCESQLYLFYLCLRFLIWNWNQSSTYLISLVKKIKELKYVNINKLKRAWQTVSPTSLCHCNYYHLYYFIFFASFSMSLRLPSQQSHLFLPFSWAPECSFLLRELRNVT